jgi:hypothetical protein
MTPEEEIRKLISELKAWAGEKYGRSAYLARQFGVSKQLVSAWFANPPRATPSWEMGLRIKDFLKANAAASKPRRK